MIRALAFAAAMASWTSVALAQDAKPDMLEVGPLEGANPRGALAWSLDAEGAVELTTYACWMCRNLQAERRSFRIAASEAARLLAILPKAEIETALRAPCTLRHATSGWASPVDLSYRFALSTTHSGFFRTCASPELDAMVAKLRRIGAELLTLEPAASTQP